MENNNKILHINSYYNGSGFYKNLYDNQVKSNLDIDVFVPVYKVYKNNPDDFGKYTCISHNHKKWHRFIFHYKQKLIMDDIMKHYNINDYSLIHAHSLFTNGNIAYQLKLKYDIPYIVAVRSTDVNTFFKNLPFLRMRGIKILINASSIIFLSTSYRDYVLRKYIPKKYRKTVMNKTNIVPNGIDPYWHEMSAGSKNINDKKNINIICVGVINKNKNQITTVKAIEHLAEKGINVKGTFVGRVIDKNVYKVIEHSKECEYVSPLTKENLIHIYRKNDILVLPSFTETFGLVYPEAMSQGLPVIYSKGQGFDGTFENGCVGYAVNAKSCEDIARCIQLIVADYTRISKNAVCNSKQFNWDEIGRVYNQLYKKAIGNTPNE